MPVARSWWPVLGLLALALALVLQFEAGGGAYQVYQPTGYVSEVDGLIAAGKLAYDCESETIRPVGLTAAEQFFFDHSYLRDDVRAWAAGDRRPFLVDREVLRGGGCRGSLVRADPTHHNQRLPTYVANRWTGSLLLSHGRVSAILTSPTRTLELSSPAWRSLPLPARAFEEVRFGAGEPGIRSPKLGFALKGRRRLFASLRNVGDQAVLESLESRPEMALNGCRQPLGWRLRLDAGDLLRLGGGLDEHYVVETGERSGLVSFVSEINGEPRRRTLEDRLAMAREIAWAIDAVVVAGLRQSGGAAGAARSDFDVHLTLDPFLNQRLEGALSGFCRRYRRPLRAAVALMEAESGRLLALASYPTGRDLDAADPRRTWPRRELLKRNHNFLQHPIGSAAKPFLAAAALAAEPRLATLETPCVPADTAPESLLGYPIGSHNLPADCHGGDDRGMVDFESFLTVSSNRYMLYLGSLALARWRGGAPVGDRAAEPLPPEERWGLAGRTFDHRPELPFVRHEAGVLVAELGKKRLFTGFRDLFGHRVEYRKRSTVEGLDPSLWRPVIDLTVADERDNSVLSFSTITPEAVDLRANLAQSFRQDLYTLFLGNGNNRWSNVHLAEGLARLVTGRPVRAQLIERVTAPGAAGEPEVLYRLQEPPPAAAWPLPEASRSLVESAMRTVVEAAKGTARRLQPALATLNAAAPPGVSYRLLGKTGTPTMPRRVVERGPSRPAPAAIERYATGGEQVESAVLVLAIERLEGEQREVLTAAVYVEAQGESREAVDLMAELLAPILQSYWPEDWLRPPGAEDRG